MMNFAFAQKQFPYGEEYRLTLHDNILCLNQLSHCMCIQR